jgi:DNA (cytosine-5)-methyltransferase 1
MRVVSLFSGAGGLDLGLIQAGHDVIWANDFDADSCKTYAHNIGPHIVCEDIEKVKSADIPDADLIVGGFPCQGFSLANLLRTPEDSRNKMYKHLHRIIKDKRPKYFLAENVRGLLSLAKGAIIKKICKDFERIGYRVKYQVFNTADFGVPQSRVRVLIVGSIDEPGVPELQFPEPMLHKANWVSISDALKGIPEPETPHGKKLVNHVCSQYKVTNRNFTGHRRTDPLKPSPTILARGNGKGGVCAIQHPRNHRRMSVRESASIQTFPMDFEFFGSMSSMYRQVGNAVPVLFARRVGEKLNEIEAIKKCA